MDICFNKDIRTKNVEVDEFPRTPVKYVTPAGIVGEETICGADDFQDIEKYNGQLGVSKEFVQNHQAPVGQIQWNNDLATKYDTPGDVSGVRWGSGTMISKDLFLTAGHCFDSSPNGWTVPRINNTNNPILPNEIAQNMKVNFNYQLDPSGNFRDEESYQIVELMEHRNGKLDYAIVRVEGNPGEKYGYTKISSIDANENDMLCIIQHPEGQPKKVEAGPLTFIKNDERVGYSSIDTLGGSSGSGILQYTTGTIVGVHTNGGCGSTRDGFNYGVRISSLIAVSPTIQQIIKN